MMTTKRQLRARLAAAHTRITELEAPPELTAEETSWYHQQFKDGKGCPTCGGLHARSCPRVKSVEYEASSGKVSIRRVTFWPPGKWDTDGIVFPDQLPIITGNGT